MLLDGAEMQHPSVARRHDLGRVWIDRASAVLQPPPEEFPEAPVLCQVLDLGLVHPTPENPRVASEDGAAQPYGQLGFVGAAPVVRYRAPGQHAVGGYGAVAEGVLWKFY